MKTSFPILQLALLFSLATTAFSEETKPDPIDWKKATALFQRSKAGEELTADEQAYLDRAREERRAKGRSRREDPATRGDSGKEKYAGGITIPESVSPVENLTVTASDGNKMDVVWRKPPGDGPFPAIITIHGGAGKQNVGNLKKQALENPLRTRLLAAGYLVVTSTFRTYADEMQSRGPILDNVAVIEAVKNFPQVDPESVAVYGGSGGGNITLELAGETSIAAGVAGEPATIIFTGMLQKISEKGTFMSEPGTHYTEELKALTETKIAKIEAPLLILHGDLHPLKKINHEIVIPALRSAGKDVTVEVWPGKPHGFYWGKSMVKTELDKLMMQVEAFLKPHLKTQATPMKIQ